MTIFRRSLWDRSIWTRITFCCIVGLGGIIIVSGVVSLLCAMFLVANLLYVHLGAPLTIIIYFGGLIFIAGFVGAWYDIKS